MASHMERGRKELADLIYFQRDNLFLVRYKLGATTRTSKCIKQVVKANLVEEYEEVSGECISYKKILRSYDGRSISPFSLVGLVFIISSSTMKDIKLATYFIIKLILKENKEFDKKMTYPVVSNGSSKTSIPFEHVIEFLELMEKVLAPFTTNKNLLSNIGILARDIKDEHWDWKKRFAGVLDSQSDKFIREITSINTMNFEKICRFTKSSMVTHAVVEKIKSNKEYQSLKKKIHEVEKAMHRLEEKPFWPE